MEYEFAAGNNNIRSLMCKNADLQSTVTIQKALINVAERSWWNQGDLKWALWRLVRWCLTSRSKTERQDDCDQRQLPHWITVQSRLQADPARRQSTFGLISPVAENHSPMKWPRRSPLG